MPKGDDKGLYLDQSQFDTMITAANNSTAAVERLFDALPGGDEERYRYALIVHLHEHRTLLELIHYLFGTPLPPPPRLEPLMEGNPQDDTPSITM